MWNRWVAVEQLADSVAAVVAVHEVSVLVHNIAHERANVMHIHVRLYYGECRDSTNTLRDRVSETLIGTLHQSHTLIGYLSHKEGLIQVSVISLVVDRHVQIHNISVLQLAGIGNAVTYHLVHRAREKTTRIEYVHTLFGKK